MYKQSSNNNSISYININQYENKNHQIKDFEINNNNLMKNNDKCKNHNMPYIKFCTNCSSDICQYCISSHDNHLLINYNDISPNDEEINTLKITIKTITEDYSKLFEEIIKWKKKIEEMIFFFEQLIEKNEIINDIDFVNNYNNLKKNYLTIIKFRQIFSSVVSPEKSNKNNNIMKIACCDNKYNMGYYNYYQYNISKTLLESLINNNNNNNINNKDNDNEFINKSNLIIKYLWATFSKTHNNELKENTKKINIKKLNKNRSSKSYYDTGTYCGSLRLNNDEEYFFNVNNNKERNYSNNKSKIIEKHIDLKNGSKKNIKKKTNMNESYTDNTQQMNNNIKSNIFVKNINKKSYNNNTEINDEFNNKSLSTSYSSNNLFANTTFNRNNKNLIYTKQNNKNKIYEKLISYTPIVVNKDNNNNHQRIYSKKRCSLNLNNTNINFSNKLNQTFYNITNPFDLKNDEDNKYLTQNTIMNTNNNNNIISINIPKKTKYMGRSNSLKYLNKNIFNPNNVNHNNAGKENEIITCKYIPEIRTKTLINNNTLNKGNNNNISKNNNKINSINININNNNQGKIFKHKKLNNDFEVIKNINNDQEKLNQTQLYNKQNDNFQEEQLNNSNLLNNSHILNNTFTQSYLYNSNIQKNIIILKKDSQSNKNIQFKDNSDNNTNKVKVKSSLFPNNASQNTKNNNSIHIIKNEPDTKYLINPNETLCIGLDLDNSECRISLVNQMNGDIELFCFEKDQYSIPTIISFSEKNEIIIGHEAESMNINNPTQTIFNLLKMVGKNYNEIKGMKEIWPFKLYSDKDNDRPYIKITFIKNEKKFYIEDL